MCFLKFFRSKVQNKEKLELDFNEVKKRCRILIIDDKEFEYTSLFEKDGYSVSTWKSNADIQLEKIDSNEYEIILLDIDGVATDRSEKHGFGLLEYIKDKNPAQIVVIYSANSFGLEDQKYIKLANESLKKSSDYYDFKSKVDELLEKYRSLSYYLGVLKLISPKIDNADIEEAIKKAISEKGTNSIREKLESINLSSDLIEKAVAVINLILKIFNGSSL